MRAVPELLRTLFRFGIVGITAAGVHAGIFLALVEMFNWSGLAANIAGFALAFVVSYLGQSRFTFGIAGPPGAVLRFLATALTGLVLNAASAWLIVDILERSPYWVLPFLLVIVPAITFLMMRFWVFPRTTRR